MTSGWVIKFKDGGEIFCSEEAYQEFFNKKNIEKIACEEHWLDLEKAKEKYPWIKLG